jgi:hypothetical protein
MANETYNTQVTTGETRLSYEHLLKSSVGNFGGDPKFSGVFLIPKSDTQTVAQVNAAIQEAIRKGREKLWGGNVPDNLHMPLKDGDGVKQNGKPYGPEAKGHWVLSATTGTDRKPKIIDLQQNEIIDPTQVYSGMYVRVMLNFAPYKQGGVSAYINTWVLKTRDGEPLAGAAADPADAFGLGGAPAQAAPQYQQQPQPQYQQPAYGQTAQPAAPYPNYGQQPAQGQKFDPITGQYK